MSMLTTEWNWDTAKDFTQSSQNLNKIAGSVRKARINRIPAKNADH